MPVVAITVVGIAAAAVTGLWYLSRQPRRYLPLLAAGLVSSPLVNVAVKQPGFHALIHVAGVEGALTWASPAWLLAALWRGYLAAVALHALVNLGPFLFQIPALPLELTLLSLMVAVVVVAAGFEALRRELYREHPELRRPVTRLLGPGATRS